MSNARRSESSRQSARTAQGLSVNPATEFALGQLTWFKPCAGSPRDRHQLYTSSRTCFLPSLGMRTIRDRLSVVEAQIHASSEPDPLAEFRDRPAGTTWKSL